MACPDGLIEDARDVLKNPAFLYALEKLESSIVHNWKASTTTEGREAQFHKLQALLDVKAQLESFLHGSR